MDVMTAVLTRRSEHRLKEPAPSDAEFGHLLHAATSAPDHGMLRPWRWILVRAEGRRALGECFAKSAGPERYRQVAAKPLRAPLLATLVFVPRIGHKVPEWEQLAAASAMANTLMLLLHAHGFGSIWRTGEFVDSDQVHRVLGLGKEERLLGWLYIGTPEQPGTSRRRALDDIADSFSVFAPDDLECRESSQNDQEM